MKNIIILFCLLQLASCRWFSDASTQFYHGMSFAIPDGTPAFRLGFKHGCSAATYARGNNFYKSLNKWEYDPTLIGNTEYRFGQKRGYSWCFQQAMSSNAGAVGSWDRIIHPHGYDPTFSSKNIGVAWGGMFGGSGGGLGATAGGNVGAFTSVLSGGSGGGVFSANPLWAGGSKGQIFGQ